MTLEELTESIKENRGASELLHFIANGGDVNVRLADPESTLMHLALEYGNLPMIEALFNAGADIEARDLNGWTPLHHAVDLDIDSAGQTNWEDGAFFRQLSFATAALLASLGADLNSRLENGETPRDMASHYGEKVLQKYDEIIAKAIE